MFRILSGFYRSESAVTKHKAIVDTVTTPFDFDPSMGGEELAHAL